MRFRNIQPTGRSLQAGAELRGDFAGVPIGTTLLAPFGALRAGGPLVTVASPRIVGGDGLRAWEGTGTQMVRAQMQRPIVMGTDQWITFVCVFRKRSSAIDSNVIAGFGSDSGSSGNTLFYLRGLSTNADAVEWVMQDSAGTSYTPFHTPSSGYVKLSDCLWHTVVVSTSMYDISAASLRRVYIDGMLEGEWTIDPNNLAATTFQHICANGIRRTTDIANGNFDVALVSPLYGRLDHADMRSLSRNPWQLFRTQKHRPVLRQAEGGASTTDYTGAGGFVIGGAATVQFSSHTYTYTGSGGFAIGGSAGVTVTDVGGGGGGTVSTDGCWTWFNDERVVFYNGSYYGGGMASNGDLGIWKYTPATASVQNYVLEPAFEVDDHDNPAIFIRPDGRIVAGYCRHGDAQPRVRVSTNPEDITSWGAAVTNYWTQANYSNIYQCGAYYWVAYRPTGNRQDYISRTSDFASFGSGFMIIDTDDYSNKSPYFKMCQNGPNRIDVFYNTYHPVQSDLHADLYHIYFTESGGTLVPHKTDGTVLTLPVRTTTGTLVYDSGSSNSWVWQIRPDQNGHPCVLFARFESISDHRAMFSRWTGSAWTTPVQIVATGGKIGTAAGEDYYSGGMCFDGNSVNRVYVSVKVGSYWEIQQFDTTDNGATWAKTDDITTGSSVKNCRPFSPVGHDGIKVFWWAGTYDYWTTYNTDIICAGATAGTSLQYARPSADVSQGAWTSTTASPITLYSTIDETSADDGDYISCSTVGSTCTLALSSVTDPLTGNGHILRYRVRAPYGGTFQVSLHDNASGSRPTIYASWTQVLTPTFATYEQTLTADQANAITDYATMRLSFTALGIA